MAAVSIVVLMGITGCSSGDEPAPQEGQSTTTAAAPSEAAASSSGPTSSVADQASFEALRVDLPRVPPIALPDLSELDEVGAEVEDNLGDLAVEGSGVEVVGAACREDGGEIDYQGSEGTNAFDIETDGSGSVSKVSELGTVDITVEPNGGGAYSRVGGEGGTLDIEVDADGAGSYDKVGDGTTTITTDGDGFGTYSSVGGDEGGTLDIEINDDGSGTYSRVGDGTLDITVNADGSGSYHSVGSGNQTIELDADGNWEFTDVGDGSITLKVNADGSGSLEDIGDGMVTIDVDADGNGTYEDVSEGIEETFTTDKGILDPKVVIAAPLPEFAVADRFPPLGTLGQLEPPCVTVIRLDSDVLFDFDSDQLRPEADPVLDSLAEALIATDRSLEIEGHTDSKGDDDYNLDLSERRAGSVKDALDERGVSNDMATKGLGESRPAVPNETPDGEDDPAGRQTNRRVEIVVLNE